MGFCWLVEEGAWSCPSTLLEPRAQSPKINNIARRLGRVCRNQLASPQENMENLEGKACTNPKYPVLV